MLAGIAEFLFIIFGLELNCFPEGKWNNDDFYTWATVFMLIIPSLISFAYYYIFYGALGWVRSARRNWWISVMVSAFIAFIAVLIIFNNGQEECIVSVKDQSSALDGSDIISYAFISALIAPFIFFITSLIAKWGSPHASRTPF